MKAPRTAGKAVTDAGSHVYDVAPPAVRRKAVPPIWLRWRPGDGLVVRGALVFNQYKGTGRLINIEKEVSVDFDIGDVRDLKF